MTIPTYPTLKGLHLPILRTPQWDTDTQISISGKRTAFARRAFPRYIFSLTYQFLRSDSVNLEQQALQSFFNSVNGQAGLFYFVDPEDNTATAQSFGQGDGTTTAFQLTRAMTGPASTPSFAEPVFGWLTAVITNGGTPQVINTDYTLSTTGLVTFTVPPPVGNALLWTGTFAYICRFDQDEYEFSKDFATTLWSLKKITLSSELF